MIASILYLSCAATVATARPGGANNVAFLSSSSSFIDFPQLDRLTTTTTIIEHSGTLILLRCRPRRRRPWSSSTSLSGRNKYAINDKTDGDDAAAMIDEQQRQRELLFDLESKLDYEGRISSRLISISSAVTTYDDKIIGEEDDYIPTVTMTAHQQPQHRCGLITILGMPNMGKSTLLNAVLADNLAIVNPRPQTTRHAILGVMTHNNTQLCLTDTPGLIGNPAYKMQEGMMDVVRSSVRDADIYLVVTDVYSGRGYNNWGEGIVEMERNNNDQDEEGEGIMGIGTDMLNRLRTSGRPVIVCVNKVDLVTNAFSASSSSSSGDNINTPTRAAYTIQKWRSILPNAFAILPTCAANGPNDVGVVALRSILLANEVDINIDVGASIRALGRPVPGMFPIDNHDSDAAAGATTTIATTTMPIFKSSSLSFDERCKEIIPIGPPLYHSDFFTDRTDRFCASELIREVLFTSLGKELPYCCEVRVETFDELRRYVDNDDGNTSDDDDIDDDDDNDDDSDDNINNNNDDDVISNTKKNKAGLIRIGATILVERDSQKGIVVGKGGIKIRDVGIAARKKLQDFFGCKVILDLRVKVDKNWRNDVEKLKKYGYMQ